MQDKRLPFLQFYPSDWRSDEALRMCSLAARGLWIECLALMHRAEPYGHLVVKGKAPTVSDLAKLVAASPKEVERLLTELCDEEVCSRSDDGIIISRRMLRDERRRARDRDRKRRQRGTDDGTDSGTSGGTDGGTTAACPTGTASGTIPEARGQRPEARESLPDSEDRNPPGSANGPRSSPSVVVNGEHPEQLRLTSPRSQAKKPAPPPGAQLAFIQRYQAAYAEHRGQAYGQPEAREWRHVKDLLAQFGADRMWVMAERFIGEPSTEYPFNGGRTITEFFTHRRLIEGRLIEAGVLSPSASPEPLPEGRHDH